MIVHGFPSKVTALMFEHAWQHSYHTRHIQPADRIVKTKTAGRSLAHKLGNVRLLLNSPFFNKMQLKVHCFTTESYKAWCDDKFGNVVGEHVHVTHIQESKRDEELNMRHVVALKQQHQEEDAAMLDRFGDILSQGAKECEVCHSTIDYINNDTFPLLCLCSQCEGVSHLHCIAKQQQQQQQQQQQPQEQQEQQEQQQPQEQQQLCDPPLVPFKVKCPSCECTIPWPLLVRRATRVRSKFSV